MLLMLRAIGTAQRSVWHCFPPPDNSDLTDGPLNMS